MTNNDKFTVSATFTDRGVEMRHTFKDGSQDIFSYVMWDRSFRTAHIRADGYVFVESWNEYVKVSRNKAAEIASLHARKVGDPVAIMQQLMR